MLELNYWWSCTFMLFLIVVICCWNELIAIRVFIRKTIEVPGFSVDYVDNSEEVSSSHYLHVVRLRNFVSQSYLRLALSLFGAGG